MNRVFLVLDQAFWGASFTLGTKRGNTTLEIHPHQKVRVTE